MAGVVQGWLAQMCWLPCALAQTVLRIPCKQSERLGLLRRFGNLPRPLRYRGVDCFEVASRTPGCTQKAVQAADQETSQPALEPSGQIPADEQAHESGRLHAQPLDSAYPVLEEWRTRHRQQFVRAHDQGLRSLQKELLVCRL